MVCFYSLVCSHIQSYIISHQTVKVYYVLPSSSLSLLVTESPLYGPQKKDATRAWIKEAGRMNHLKLYGYALPPGGPPPPLRPILP